jgi:hypothetical protein
MRGISEYVNFGGDAHETHVAFRCLGLSKVASCICYVERGFTIIVGLSEVASCICYVERGFTIVVLAETNS